MRSIWNGAIQFGLVTIPISLYSTVEEAEKISFNQLDGESMSRIRQKKVRESDGAEVANDTIVKGWPTGGDTYVVVTNEEIEAIQGKNPKIIDLIGFARADQPLDPIFYDSAYYISPNASTTGPLQLLMDAMGSMNVYAVGQFMVRNRQYLCQILLSERGLVLHTLRWPETIREPEAWSGIYMKAHLPMAEQLIAAQTMDTVELGEYRDPYADAIKELVKAKQAGKVIQVLAQPDPGSIENLMEALEASIAATKAAR